MILEPWEAIEIFRALPHNYFIIDVDAPRFTIVGASNRHLYELNLKREEVIGRGVFELFPDSEKQNFSTDKLRASFMKVIETMQTDNLMLRYDIPTQDGFEYRYWTVENAPFIWENKVRRIINCASNITPVLKNMGILNL